MDTWCARWKQPRGHVITLEQCWGLALAWYGDDRRAADWRRKTQAEAIETFVRLGLDSAFWRP